jgi:hypothetical protein
MVQAQRPQNFTSNLSGKKAFWVAAFILLFAVLFISTIRTLLPSYIDGSLLFVDEIPIIHEQAAVIQGPIKVAFAVSVTACGAESLMTDAAAVLKHSIHRASVHGPLGGRYDYDCIAIYHPQAHDCAVRLKELGWTPLEREILVNVSDIRGEYMRNSISGTGCCGEKEFLKLEAYTLTDYPIVVHLDLDSLIIKPMDDLFDILMSESPIDADRYKSILMHHPNQTMPRRVNVLFTYDYNMVTASVKYKPVQGGFVVLRPDMKVYEDFRQVILEGDFRNHAHKDGPGWGSKVGPFYGGMSFQGIVPYYYDVLQPGQSLELNRCVFNQMSDDPREPTIDENKTILGVCLTGETECEDCRARPVDDIVTAHFTICQKPWWCHAHTGDMIEHRLCRNLMREWFLVRSDLEKSWGRPGRGPGSYETDTLFGFCKGHGDPSYIPIEPPYGSAQAGDMNASNINQLR